MHRDHHFLSTKVLLPRMILSFKTSYTWKDESMQN